jgi:hypothetical protein
MEVKEPNVKFNDSKGLVVYHGISDVLSGNTASHPRRQLLVTETR